MAWRRCLSFAALLTALALSSCDEAPEAEREPRLVWRSQPIDRLPGWDEDDPGPALRAFLRSCAAFEGRAAREPFGKPSYAGPTGPWQEICRNAPDVDASGTSPDEARAFFEQRFVALQLLDGDEEEGLFTGYFEPLLHGSLEPDEAHSIPLRRKPGDLVRVDLGEFSEELEGRKITGRLEGDRLRPYPSRAEIDRGALEGRGLEFLWVDNPVDKFFLQIQGSGQVQLAHGGRVRVGYAGQNGRRYRAIGRDLIDAGHIAREDISLQSIRAWLEAAGPEAASAMMQKNPSYIFFAQKDGLDSEAGPLGTQGVQLEAGRSLAVDRRFVPLGAPLWLDATAPLPEGETPIRRLLVAQDTGGAIKGVVRGDVFWGAGERARWIAGHMKATGRLFVLVPRAVLKTS